MSVRARLRGRVRVVQNGFEARGNTLGVLVVCDTNERDRRLEYEPIYRAGGCTDILHNYWTITERVGWSRFRTCKNEDAAQRLGETRREYHSAEFIGSGGRSWCTRDLSQILSDGIRWPSRGKLHRIQVTIQ